MASVNFLKINRQTAGALGIHLDDAKRRQHHHSNKHIDVSQSYKNYVIGNVSTYNDMLSRLDQRIKEVDADNPPLRRVKDRKIACLLEAPCPQPIIDNGRADEFFQDFYALIEREFGAENVIGATVHKDEVHDYIDRGGTQRKSLEHVHAMVACYAEWTDSKGHERKGINAKNFETREMLVRFNKAINEMCIEKYGIEYNTHGLAEHKTVEELKKRSEIDSELKKRNKLIKEHNALIDTITELRKGAVNLAYDIIEMHERGRERGR